MIRRPSRRRLAAGWLASGLALSACGAGPTEVLTEGTGRLRGLVVAGGDTVPVMTDMAVVATGWTAVASMSAWEVEEPEHDGGEGGAETWRGLTRLDSGSFRYEQTVTATGSAVQVRLEVRAERDAELEGLFFYCKFPTRDYAGGRCRFGGDDPASTVRLPVLKPSRPRLHAADTGVVTVGDPAARRSVTVRLPGTARVLLQDNRQWNDPVYALLFPFHQGGMRAGQRVETTVRFLPRSAPQTNVVRVAVDPGKPLGTLDGFGGNYCFAYDSPVTDYTLRTLESAWVRTELDLADWEPENDNDDPRGRDWDALRAADRQGSPLRKRFLLARRLARTGARTCAAVWAVPEWLCKVPGLGKQAQQRWVPRERWPELVECIVSYLQHLKQRHEVEFDLFAFNEPDIGIRVLFTAEEHRELIAMLAAELERAGLRTRLMLGDVSSPGQIGYAETAAADPGIMPHVGAVAFHSWGGASPSLYEAWSALAERLERPLLVTELGVDPSAWKTPWLFDDYNYGLREAVMYQQLLRWARPQGLMHWEFTPDYRLVREEQERARPTVRYWLVRHFCNLTPCPAQILHTTSSDDDVPVTAFRGTGARGAALCIHLVNRGQQRRVELTGLPRQPAAFEWTETGPDVSFVTGPPVRSANGQLALNLPPRSLVTLRAQVGTRAGAGHDEDAGPAQAKGEP